MTVISDNLCHPTDLWYLWYFEWLLFHCEGFLFNLAFLWLKVVVSHHSQDSVPLPTSW